MISAQEALDRLKAGNHRFVSRLGNREVIRSHARQIKLVQVQKPFAIVLGCADSRVPAELVFDQGVGDLFVIRVAGNIVAPTQVGSVEYAATWFGTRLVVVLGHTQCGAVLATIDALRRQSESPSSNLHSIVSRIQPAIERLIEAPHKHDEEELVRRAVRANVRHSVERLRHSSDMLEQMIRDDGLLVVGAEYSLETGLVEFLDDATAG
jgi:carbonic anhydrase